LAAPGADAAVAFDGADVDEGVSVGVAPLLDPLPLSPVPLT
jgi:hypothetical protein